MSGPNADLLLDLVAGSSLPGDVTPAGLTTPAGVDLFDDRPHGVEDARTVDRGPIPPPVPSGPLEGGPT